MRWKRWVVAVSLVLLLAGIGFVAWAETPAAPMPAALTALQSDAQVRVEDRGKLLVFSPSGSVPQAGLIFYPGGRVDFRAYAPAAHAIAESGYLVAIPKMPLNLAVFGADSADGVLAAYSDIGAWVIGGHSLGGAMAAHYALQNPGAIRGLLLFASYPASGDDLSRSGIFVTSVYGTSDGVAPAVEVKAAAPRLPADTRWVAIEGGNHAGFGWYGEQKGDGPAAISREAQQEQAVQAALDLLAQIEKK